MAAFLRIAQWNVNGLLNHQAEIKIILNINVIDILLISESHFTNKSCIYPNYKLYQTNHPDGTAHGGAAIVIQEKVEHYELPKHEEYHIQASSINVKTFPYATTITAV
jgi:exonuclease III